jgi:hypothetical protein
MALLMVIGFAYLQNNLLAVPEQGRIDTPNSAFAAELPHTDATKEVSKLLGAWSTEFATSFTYSASSSRNDHYSWSIITPDQANEHYEYFAMLDDQLDIYSATFFDRAGITEIIFVDHIITKQGQPVLGFADTLAGKIFLNVEAARSQTPLVKSTFHHELAHSMFYELLREDMYTFEQWPSQSYVNEYASTSIAEDMAETYAYGVTDELKVELQSMAANDPLLQKKVALIDDLLMQIGQDPLF